MSSLPGPSQATQPPLRYNYTPFHVSSQQAADLYQSGTKLWTPEILTSIESQLSSSLTLDFFIVQCLDGSIVRFKNPMFGVQKLIWKPHVKFQEYWPLVRSQPDGPAEIYNCTYLIEWVNQTRQKYEGPIPNARELLESGRKRWEESQICSAFVSQFRELLIKSLQENGAAKKVTKLICFGLGDLNFKPQDWWRIQNNAKRKEERQLETSLIEGPVIHHAVALTMADVIRSCAKQGDEKLRIMTQDPHYSAETKVLLQNLGFEVVGDHGAGGFAEVDDESVVFSAFAKAPVTQIVADLARPVAIICPRKTGADIYNQLSKPQADPESPRTREMWRD